MMMLIHRLVRAIVIELWAGAYAGPLVTVLGPFSRSGHDYHGPRCPPMGSGRLPRRARRHLIRVGGCCVLNPDSAPAATHRAVGARCAAPFGLT